MSRRRGLYTGLLLACLWLPGSEVSTHASEPTVDVDVCVRAACRTVTQPQQSFSIFSGIALPGTFCCETSVRISPRSPVWSHWREQRPVTLINVPAF